MDHFHIIYIIFMIFRLYNIRIKANLPVMMKQKLANLFVVSARRDL